MENAPSTLWDDVQRKLVEGTEVLRTGGGATLGSDECAVILDEVDRLRAALEHIASLPHISASAGRRADFLAKEALRG